jgi:hypothetical protein
VGGALFVTLVADNELPPPFAFEQAESIRLRTGYIEIRREGFSL